MQMTKRICVLLAVMLLAGRVDAQYSINNDDAMLRQMFGYHVKQLAQFFSRFNHTEQVTFHGDDNPNRMKNLISLLNLQDSVLRKDPATIEFLKFVDNPQRNVHINLQDDEWYAVAHCAFIYHNKERSIDIILKQEATSKKRYYWVIDDISGDLFSDPAGEKQSLLFINPMNHEIGFSELSRALNKNNSIPAYTSSTFSLNPLSAFLCYVQNGDIKFRQIKSVDFYFLQIDGWFFKVSNFTRLQYNSGWLIAAIKKMGSDQKNTLRKNHFSL